MRKVLYLFGVLTDADLETLLQIGTRRRLQDGEILIHEGQPADSVILLLEGELLVTKTGVGQIAGLGAGEIVGEMSLVDSALPSATITSRGQSLGFFIDKTILLQKLESDAPFGCRFYRALAILLADRLRATMQAPPLGERGVADEIPILQDELDPGILDALSSAGERFQRMLKAVAG